MIADDATGTAMLPAFETLRTAADGAVLTVWLNRPDARNAMNLRMCDELLALFGMLRFDRTLRAVVIRGEGSSFCAGVDIRELAAHDADWVLIRRNRGLDAFLAIETCPLPVICATHGPTIGAGCEIAGACDFVISSDAAFFQWPEALRGGVGATQRLPRAVGRPMAKELLFTARKVGAEEARAIGFVNRVVKPEAFDTAVRECIDGITGCGPIAVRLIKQAINLGETLDRNSAVNLERQLIEQSMAHDEWQTSIAAFAART